MPVLSSNNVFTSPAASTARPDIAKILRCTRRSIPAIPIADSKAPIVVGIRQTRSETKTTMVCCAWLKIASGCKVTTANMKIMVKLASRMLSAISFGVFWRDAPSTRAIMRSIKVSPGRAVIRTTIRSERTRVPPVTEERSPPASRITGADSPVIADSSTLAMPSMISPSLGIRSPASQTTMEPSVNSLDATMLSEPSVESRRAIELVRVLRKVSACALPRPSAIASAKLANSTVPQSQATIHQVNTLLC